MEQKKRTSMLLIALTVLIDFTGFGLVLPLLPFWAQRLGANAVGVGLILSVYALAQFLFTPVLGTLSDRYGRKPVIFSSLLLEAASLAFSALAGSLPLLLLARFIGGMGASNIGSAQAVISDVTTPKERARGMGMIGAAIGLGFVIGPALGGMLSPLGATVPFWCAAAVALVNALLVLLLLPETRNLHSEEVQRGQEHGHGPAVFVSAWRNTARYPAVMRQVAIGLLFNLAFTAMEAVFPLFTQHTFGWAAVQNGYIFTYVGVIVVIMQGGLVGRLVKRWNEQALLIVGLAILSIGLVLLAFSTQLALLLITLGLVSVGDGMVTPINSTLLSFAAPNGKQGETLGLAQGVFGLGRVISPFLAGSLYGLSAGLPFILGGILVALAAVLALVSLPGKTANPVLHEEKRL